MSTCLVLGAEGGEGDVGGGKRVERWRFVYRKKVWYTKRAVSERLSELLAHVGGSPFRASQLNELGISRGNLSRWVEQGALERLGRGLYRATDVELTELTSIAEVARRAPNSTICLLSALQYYRLGVEVPGAVWLMIERHARAPKIDFVRTEVVRASGAALTHGVQHCKVEGVSVAWTSPAKTVADCFRYRHHVGLETALDALRDYLRPENRRRGGDFSVAALSEAMKACRIASLMRPYVEALV